MSIKIKTAWIQHLRKFELEELLKNFNLHSTGTNDELRKRVRQFVRTFKEIGVELHDIFDNYEEGGDNPFVIQTIYRFYDRQKPLYCATKYWPRIHDILDEEYQELIEEDDKSEEEEESEPVEAISEMPSLEEADASASMMEQVD